MSFAPPQSGRPQSVRRAFAQMTLLAAACLLVGPIGASGQEPRVWALSDFRTGSILRLAISPDGRIVAAAGESTIRLSDTATGRELSLLTAGRTSPVRDLAFSPDGKTLASGGSQAVLRWDVEAALKKTAGP